MGDFNYPSIDFVNHTVKTGEDSVETQFFNKTQDLFLVQHVTEATIPPRAQIIRVAVDMKFHINISISTDFLWISMDIHIHGYPWISISTDISAI